jgi:hypothetical protein
MRFGEERLTKEVHGTSSCVIYTLYFHAPQSGDIKPARVKRFDIVQGSQNHGTPIRINNMVIRRRLRIQRQKPALVFLTRAGFVG